MADTELLYTYFDSPVGKMIVVVNDDGICLLEFEYRKRLQEELDYLKKEFGKEIIEGRNEHTENIISQMKEYFVGERRDFDIPLVYAGTDFQKKVWKILEEIPYGETRSYKAQAIAYGNPEAIRAVAKANGDNRIAVVIPCHRIIGMDGKLVGYGGGLWRKRWLLNHEQRILAKQLSLEI